MPVNPLAVQSSTDTDVPPARRWLILAVIAIAQLMVVLDVTIVNIALPSAQKSLHFSAVDRQWVVTAYALAFGSLLLLGGRLADLLGRKVTFLAGLGGFAAASALGGASVSFSMLVAARALQGAFGALLAPAALSLLTTTFTGDKERGKAFGVFGAIAGAGGAIGLLLGGILTEYLSWRWCLFVNLFFAAVAIPAAAVLLRRQPSPGRPHLDFPGLLLVSGGMFCVVYGFSNAADHPWGALSTWGFLTAGGILLAAFGWWQTRASGPLLPPHVVLNRNRGGAYISVLIASGGMFGIFLILSYYVQETLGYSPLRTGLAFLPITVMLIISANVATIILMPRFGLRPLVVPGMLLAAGGMVWLAGIGVHSAYVSAILPPLLILGTGLGLVFAPAINASTSGVAPGEAGVASATVNTCQQLGGSVGAAVLNSIAASAAASYLVTAPRVRSTSSRGLITIALVHGYSTAFWWTAAIFAVGAVVAGALLRRGPLTGHHQVG
jgi:EmrB/QacA subfamily drug resistance transporter